MMTPSTSASAESVALDQHLIDEIYRRRARQLADRRATSTRARTIPVLVFGLGTERYAIELSELAEVLPYSGCSPVPGAPRGLVGVLNVRGEIRSVADLRAIVGLEPGAAHGTGYVLMLRQQGQVVGFKVDTIDHVGEIDPELCRTGASAPAVPGVRCVKALTPDAVIVLDTSAALAELSPLFA